MKPKHHRIKQVDKVLNVFPLSLGGVVYGIFINSNSLGYRYLTYLNYRNL